MTEQEFIDILEQKYKELFPNGYFKAYISTMFDLRRINIRVGLIENQMDCSHNIRDNDIGMGRFTVDPTGVKVSIEGHQKLTCLPLNPYHALSHRGPDFRKANKKSLDDAAKHLISQFEKFKEFVRDNKDVIYQKDNYNSKYLEF